MNSLDTEVNFQAFPPWSLPSKLESFKQKVEIVFTFFVPPPGAKEHVPLFHLIIMHFLRWRHITVITIIVIVINFMLI